MPWNHRREHLGAARASELHWVSGFSAGCRASPGGLASLGVWIPLLVAADRWLAKYQGKTAMFRQVDPEALVKVTRLYLAAGQPDRAAEAARGILDAFRLIQPPNVLIEQA